MLGNLRMQLSSSKHTSSVSFVRLHGVVVRQPVGTASIFDCEITEVGKREKKHALTEPHYYASVAFMLYQLSQ